MTQAFSDLRDRGDHFVAVSARDLLEQAARSTVLVATAATLIWLLLFGMARSELAAQAMPVALTLAVVAAVALHLLPRRSWLGQAIFLVGWWAVIGLAATLLEQPEVIILWAVLPLIGASSANVPLTAAACALAVAGVWGGAQLGLPELAAPLPQLLIPASLLAGLLSWTTAYTLLASVRRSLECYVQSEANLVASREQRVQFLQVQEDLMLANRELARLSDRLKVLTQLAEDARRVKEDFVANVSHELRTPLNMIIGFSEVILKSPKLYGVRLPDPLLADIRAIQRNSQHLAGLVNDVLALSQAESGKLVLAREWVNLGDLLGETQEAVKILFESKGLYLRLELPADPIILFCDRLRIREVVLNLLSNAGRFTVEGGVILRAWQEEAHALISVTDSGPGIPAKDQTRIFEPFQRLTNSSPGAVEGSGLGLSISKRFVEMHDGEIWLESELGRGTTFYLRLPLEPLPDAAPRPGAARWINPYQIYEARTRRSEAPVPVVASRFVVMEESDHLQRLFAHFAEGIEIVATHAIPELIAESRRAPATAVVINTPAPEAVVAEIRAAGGIAFDTPMLICWIPGERDAARNLGVMRYLVKPISQDALIAAISEVKAGPKTVLVVDDNPEALQLFSRMLASAAAEVRVLRAMSGLQALDLMRARQPDVVLLDLVMPEMDGFQVLREKEQDPAIRQIPVLVVSSLDPMRGMVVSNLLSVSRRNGLTSRELLACIQAISSILTQEPPPTDPMPPERPSA
jgi:signal transduction histidine kinase/DNA-binding NarL/FixJ family response regulator